MTTHAVRGVYTLKCVECVYTLYNCDSDVQHTYQDVRLDGGVRVRGGCSKERRKS